ncbi:hypothetical protein BGW36DRAFT_28506 [Talaromyces proteolyticus]|uniref:DUF7703 domain-containing protein n=1 Tax=Talaromyces proteolyticus TaxID=1131652 RepID=A0AAD4PX79_9EURO|nr:uncharacterized protein BGW36DRAFT_28506 [Talaromyces proteolyticus]KAH8692836.1 hypothetical protein BGW36DRAFT_28506 [Talaromyces proteolyticus]
MPSVDTISAGLVSGIEGSSLTVKIVVAVALSIALYNAIELVLLIFCTFHRYHGLYFWSLLISNVCGVIPTTIGAVLHFFLIGPLWLALTISHVGFYAMVPVQSLVLYSRLHLVFHDEKRLRYILYLIIIDALLFLPATTTTMYGSAYVQNLQWNKAYQVVERLQVTGFCIQEFLISCLYIREAVKLLRLNPEKGSRQKNIMYQLVAINLIIILMDIGILVWEYLGFYYLQVSLKSLVYSIKLKLEFAVLGKLVTITRLHTQEAIHSDPAIAPVFVKPDYSKSTCPTGHNE